MVKKLYLISKILILAIPFMAQTHVVLPRDEASRDASLAAFVLDLKKAIIHQDENWLISVLDDEVVSSFGDEPGIPSFLQYWAPESNDALCWTYLRRIVEMGGVFLYDSADHSGKYQFVFPYVYDTDVTGDDNYYLLGVVTGKNVNLRKSPDTQGEVIKRLSYDLVYFNMKEEGDGLMTSGNNADDAPMWYKVTTHGNEQGWINWQYVYPVGGPRLFLYKDDIGVWKISAFVAGD